MPNPYNSRAADAVVQPPLYHSLQELGIDDPLYDPKYHNIAAPGTNPLGTVPIVPGMHVRCADGRMYRYIKAGGAIAVGEIIKPTVTAKSYAAETAVAYLASDPDQGGLPRLAFPNVAVATEGSLVGGVIHRSTAAGTFDSRMVVYNRGIYVWIDRALTTSPAATDDFIVAMPYQGLLVSAAGDPVIGVAALGAITSGNFGWLQISGICLALAAGAAVAAGVYLAPNASGRAITAVGTTDAAKCILGFSLDLAAANGDLFPAYLQGIGY